MTPLDDYTSLSGPQRRRILDQVLARDGWVCCICGLSIAPGDESLQHKTPRSKGGTTSLLDPSSLGPAHKRCNYSAGARVLEGPATVVHSGLTYFTRPTQPDEQRPTQPATRLVIALFGPPGAGKTTRAHALAAQHALKVYDVDDDQWGGHYDRRFRAALAAIGRDPNARAVVIAAGATDTARHKLTTTVRATTTETLTQPLDVLIERITTRNRPRPPIRQQIAAARDWLAQNPQT